jgi:hypothetical protein
MQTSFADRVTRLSVHSSAAALTQTNAPSTGSGQATRRPASPTTTGAGRRKTREPVLSRVEGPRASLAAKGGRHAHGGPPSRLGPGWRGRLSLRRRESALLLSKPLPLQSMVSLRRTALRSRSRAAQTPVDFFAKLKLGLRQTPVAFAPKAHCLVLKGRLPLVTRPRAFDPGAGCPCSRVRLSLVPIRLPRSRANRSSRDLGSLSTDYDTVSVAPSAPVRTSSLSWMVARTSSV